jgi:S1-C subfamily serine protease
VLTKASELPAEPKCRLPDGRVVAARVVEADPAFDLALLKTPPAGLKMVPRAARFSPAPGTLLAAVGPGELPPVAGVVSVPGVP